MKLAIGILQEVAGPCSPVLFLKMGIENWTPVGEENLYAVVKGKNATEAVVICDSEGNSKAISGWVSQTVAEEYSRSLQSKGLPLFDGEPKLPI